MMNKINNNAWRDNFQRVHSKHKVNSKHIKQNGWNKQMKYLVMVMEALNNKHSVMDQNCFENVI